MNRHSHNASYMRLLPSIRSALSFVVWGAGESNFSSISCITSLERLEVERFTSVELYA